MQVNNQQIHQKSVIPEAPLELKQGEVYRASLKEKLNGNEAILQIRGKDVRATFADGNGVPDTKGRFTVMVNGQSDQTVHVKTISIEKTIKSENKLMTSLGLSDRDPVEVTQAVGTLLDKGSRLTKENVGELKDFIVNGKGSMDSKLETVRALANKGLEPTTVQLRAVHEALHGKPIHHVLSDIANEIDPYFKLEKGAGTESIQRNGQSVGVATSAHLTKESDLATLIQKNISATQTESDLSKVISQIKEDLVNNPKMDRQSARQIDKAANEALKLQSIGRERLLQALKSAEAQLGTKEQQAIQALSKGIQAEPDVNQIAQKVQEFLLHHKSISVDTSNTIERFMKQASQLDQAGRDRLIGMLKQVDTNGSLQSGVSKSIQEALMTIQKEPDFSKAVEVIRNEINQNQNLDLQTKEQVEKALIQASQLQAKGREMAARQLVAKELTEIQQTLAKSEPQIQSSGNEAIQYDVNEQLQSLSLSSKDLLVTKISQRLAQATADFRELKRDISRNLDQTQHLITTFKKNAYPQAKQLLEGAIQKLDQAILKSDLMLFTDMKTEKQLLQASTQLAEAKKLLAKGQHVEAGKIVQDIKTLMDKVVFKPSEQKIMHYVNKETLMVESRTPSQQVLTHLGQTMQSGEPSSRQMFEMIRSLGLNHESDVANSLVFQKQDASRQEQQNLKTALMRLAQGEGQENAKLASQAEQALHNVTGQQLLSKSDSSGTPQSMFMNLPLLLGGKPENVQVFIHSKKDGQQVEWENCNLYFLLETKKLGDVGILLNSTDRNLSITIKNDFPGLKEKVEPLVNVTKEKLHEVGYNVSSIHFTKLNQNTSTTNHASNSHVPSTRQMIIEKGMDFTI